MHRTNPSSTENARGDYFATTRWTMVLSAGRQSAAGSDRALAELCQIYWCALYSYVRHRGDGKEDAEDLVQAFFARFLEKNYLGGLTAERGRFRAFLLAALKHFLANEWDKTQRLKRGGGVEHLSLDWATAEERYHFEPEDAASPDKLFDRNWALAALDHVIARLKSECAAEGNRELFEAAKGYLTATEAAIPYSAAAEQLKIDEGAVRVAVHRLRQRYRELLREEIAGTLSDPSQVQEELRAL